MPAFINVVKMPHFVFSFAHICKEMQGGRACTKHSAQVPRRVLRLQIAGEMDVKVTQLHQDRLHAQSDSSIRDSACGMQSGLTEDSTVNTNVFKMADSVREEIRTFPAFHLSHRIRRSCHPK